MKQWRCTVCDYVHEGDEPPEYCPVCDAPASEFELVAAAQFTEEPSTSEPGSDTLSTLAQVRDQARLKLKGICGVFPACDGLADRVCQREAYGQPIGLGGVGSGSSFAANYSALGRRRLRTRVVGEHFAPDTRFSFFGHPLSMPVLAASVAGPGQYENGIGELEFCTASVQGCIEAGTLAFRGDTSFYTPEDHPSLASIEAASGRGVPIFKPREQDVLLTLIARAERLGCPAVGVDLDGCGSTNMARAGQPVFRKSISDLRELVSATSLPFVCKGVMCADDAEACVKAGAQVVGVSNHGGRVLDYTPAVAEVLPEIVQRVGGQAVITADGGVRTGYDVLIMLALGADAVLVGRDVVRAAIGGGAAGVRLHMERLHQVLRHAMFMTGCPDLEAIGPQIFQEPPAA
jgi:4-hydroxymandelate oxidase